MNRTGLPTIAQLPADQRPRERLIALGPDALTDAELLALVLGTGRPGVSSIELAHELLNEHGGIAGLATRDVVALGRSSGIDAGKGARVVASLALARRCSAAVPPHDAVRTSADIARLVRPLLERRARERVVLVVCGAGNRVLATTVVAEGGASFSALPLREILTEVLRRDGVAFAVAHNHPNGDPTPSADDRRTTTALADAAERCGLRLLDHVVVAGGEWRSGL
ncbi:JAB domain-containing protein [Pengzhenrongella sp.]|jgi:DNA repair protein RadC|uniref:JAB domain-containing protein n=1 Tax=Pengzhenrongella sp. TaxID=2888820 RepID=UPI002F938531